MNLSMSCAAPSSAGSEPTWRYSPDRLALLRDDLHLQRDAVLHRDEAGDIQNWDVELAEVEPRGREGGDDAGVAARLDIPRHVLRDAVEVERAGQRQRLLLPGGRARVPSADALRDERRRRVAVRLQALRLHAGVAHV